MIDVPPRRDVNLPDAVQAGVVQVVHQEDLGAGQATCKAWYFEHTHNKGKITGVAGGERREPTKPN